MTATLTKKDDTGLMCVFTGPCIKSRFIDSSTYRMVVLASDSDVEELRSLQIISGTKGLVKCDQPVKFPRFKNFHLQTSDSTSLQDFHNHLMSRNNYDFNSRTESSWFVTLDLNVSSYDPRLSDKRTLDKVYHNFQGKDAMRLDDASNFLQTSLSASDALRSFMAKWTWTKQSMVLDMDKPPHECASSTSKVDLLKGHLTWALYFILRDTASADDIRQAHNFQPSTYFTTLTAPTTSENVSMAPPPRTTRTRADIGYKLPAPTVKAPAAPKTRGARLVSKALSEKPSEQTVRQLDFDREVSADEMMDAPLSPLDPERTEEQPNETEDVSDDDCDGDDDEDMEEQAEQQEEEQAEQQQEELAEQQQEGPAEQQLEGPAEQQQEEQVTRGTLTPMTIDEVLAPPQPKSKPKKRASTGQAQPSPSKRPRVVNEAFSKVGTFVLALALFRWREENKPPPSQWGHLIFKLRKMFLQAKASVYADVKSWFSERLKKGKAPKGPDGATRKNWAAWDYDETSWDDIKTVFTENAHKHLDPSVTPEMLDQEVERILREGEETEYLPFDGPTCLVQPETEAGKDILLMTTMNESAMYTDKVLTPVDGVKLDMRSLTLASGEYKTRPLRAPRVLYLEEHFNRELMDKAVVLIDDRNATAEGKLFITSIKSDINILAAVANSYKSPDRIKQEFGLSFMVLGGNHSTQAALNRLNMEGKVKDPDTEMLRPCSVYLHSDIQDIGATALSRGNNMKLTEGALYEVGFVDRVSHYTLESGAPGKCAHHV